MSAGLFAGDNADFRFCKNGVPFASLFRTSTTYNGNDTIGRSVMTSLGTGDLIQIRNFGGQKARSSNLKETSFSGFKYEPKHGNRVLLFFIYFMPTGFFYFNFYSFHANSSFLSQGILSKPLIVPLDEIFLLVPIGSRTTNSITTKFIVKISTRCQLYSAYYLEVECFYFNRIKMVKIYSLWVSGCLECGSYI